MNKKYWMFAAIVLLAISFMFFLPETPEPREKKKITFPDRHNKKDADLRKKRQQVMNLLIRNLDKEFNSISNEDPFQVALNQLNKNGSAGVVFELGMIKKSFNGEKILRCLIGEKEQQDLEEFEKKTGISLMDDIERVSFSETGILLDGNFKSAKWDEVANDGKTLTEKYGQNSTLYQEIDEKGDPAEETIDSLGVYNEKIVYIGKNKTAKDVFETLEGKKVAEETNESNAFGEVYGSFSSGDLLNLLKMENSEMRNKIESSVSQIQFNVDFSDGIAIVANFTGDDEQIDDLGKTFGAMLSALRVEAEINGDSELKDFLDYASIDPDNENGFEMKVAFPQNYLDKLLDNCLAKRAESINK